MLTVAFLGPVELRRDGAQLTVPSGKITELLIRLAMDAGTMVRTDRLIEDLWSGHAVTTARNTLQSKVSGLRRALGDGGLVAGSAQGYLLKVDPTSVDALEVLRLTRSVAGLRDAGDLSTVVATCGQALKMFRGDIMPAAGDGGWLEPHRARLEEARLRLTEERLAAQLELGAADELVGELRELVAGYGLREELWKLLIIALYRAGRQAEALAAYGQVQRRLADELGLDPGPELRALEQQILRQDQRLTPLERPARPLMIGNLPGISASLIGRDHELDDVTSLVRRHRLVTMVGPAGVGKTRLAIEIARGARHSGGQWLARLETATSQSSAWHVIADALHLSESSESAVLERLSVPEMLLILDNCEHLTGSLAAVVDQMLSRAPSLRILATSQLPLGIDGEVISHLDPLTIDDAVALFTERAARKHTADADVVVESVCRSLDGLPLAIELAAARTKVLSVQEISRRLSDRFGLLNDPAGRRPIRHRTLAAAIAWSYELLFPDDQRGLWALSVFSGGAPLAGAEHVLEALGVPAASAVDVAGRLADRSLVTVDVDENGSVRYRLLDSLREFSLERLQESDLVDVARAAHAAWFAQAAERARIGSRGPAQVHHLMIARTERSNIDAALAWAAVHDPVTAGQIATGFGWTWAILGTGPEGARRIRAALAAAPASAGSALPAGIRVRGLFLSSWLEAAGGDLQQATADLDQALEIAGDHERMVGQVYLAFLRTQQGRPAEVRDLLEECRDDLQRSSNRWELGAAWLLTAWAQIALGELAAAKAACEETVRIFTVLGDNWALIHADAMLGGLAQAEGRYADATVHLARAAQAAHELGFDAARALHLGNLGRAQQQGGDELAAAATLERAVEAAVATGDLRMAALARVRLGRVYRSLRDLDAAETAAGLARRWYQSAGGGEGASLADFLAGAVAADRNRPDAADRLGEVLESSRQAGDSEVELLTLDALARWEAEHNRPDRARALLQSANALLPAVRHLVGDSDRLDRTRAVQALERVTHPPSS